MITCSRRYQKEVDYILKELYFCGTNLLDVNNIQYLDGNVKKIFKVDFFSNDDAIKVCVDGDAVVIVSD